MQRSRRLPTSGEPPRIVARQRRRSGDGTAAFLRPPMLTDADIREVLDRAAARRSPVPNDPRVSVFPSRPEDAVASLTADGWRDVGWMVDDRDGATYDVLWHAERGE